MLHPHWSSIPRCLQRVSARCTSCPNDVCRKLSRAQFLGHFFGDYTTSLGSVLCHLHGFFSDPYCRRVTTKVEHMLRVSWASTSRTRETRTPPFVSCMRHVDVHLGCLLDGSRSVYVDASTGLRTIDREGILSEHESIKTTISHFASDQERFWKQVSQRRPRGVSEILLVFLRTVGPFPFHSGGSI